MAATGEAVSGTVDEGRSVPEGLEGAAEDGRFRRAGAEEDADEAAVALGGLEGPEICGTEEEGASPAEGEDARDRRHGSKFSTGAPAQPQRVGIEDNDHALGCGRSGDKAKGRAAGAQAKFAVVQAQSAEQGLHPGPAPCNSRCCGGGVRVSVNVCSPVRRVSARVGGTSGTMVICSRPEVCDQRQAAASASPSGSAASGRQRRRDGTAYFTMYPEGE